jgi:chemotaxis regulatin CheY-phosphate phosphatase CheZ
MMDARLTITEDDYLALEDALCANARGRAFLRMRDQRARVISGDEVKRMMRSLTNSFNNKKTTVAEEPANNTHLRILRQELQEMSSSIQQTRNEVAALRPDDSGNNRIMSATGELDAIVTATERATGEILNAAERILELASRLPKTPETKSVIDDIEAQGIEILTACSFQDITGQRTTKVVSTLHYLEKRVNSMIDIWGVDELRPSTLADDVQDRRPDAHLLNGPSAQGVSQDDVDALLSEFNAVDPAAPEALTPTPIAMAPAAAAPSKPIEAAPRPASPPPPAPPAVPAPASVAAPMTKVAPPVVPAAAAVANGAANGSAAFNQNDIDALFD